MAGTLQIGGVDLATHDTGTGEVTVKGNVVVPDGGTIGSASTTDALTIDASGNTTATLSSSSNVKAPLNASGDAPVYASRAWVNFNGTGTVAIRGSGNVSSITDRGVGVYTVNFTTAMPDVNYAGCGSATIGGATNVNRSCAVGPLSTSSCYVNSWQDSSSSFYDVDHIHIAIFR